MIKINLYARIVLIVSMIMTSLVSWGRMPTSSHRNSPTQRAARLEPVETNAVRESKERPRVDSNARKAAIEGQSAEESSRKVDSYADVARSLAKAREKALAERGLVSRAWIKYYTFERHVSMGFCQWLDRRNWFVTSIIVLLLLIFPVGPFAVFFISEVHKGKVYRQPFLVSAGFWAVAGGLGEVFEFVRPTGDLGEWWAGVIWGLMALGVICAGVFCRGFKVSTERKIYLTAMFVVGLQVGYWAGQLIAEFFLIILALCALIGMGGAAAHHVSSQPPPSEPKRDPYEPLTGTLDDGTHIEQDYAGSTTWHNRDYASETYERVGENEFKQKS